jgi:hypothetical protein
MEVMTMHKPDLQPLINQTEEGGKHTHQSPRVIILAQHHAPDESLHSSLTSPLPVYTTNALSTLSLRAGKRLSKNATRLRWRCGDAWR